MQELEHYYREFQSLVKAEGGWEAPSGRRKSWRKKKESGSGYSYRKNPPGQGRTKRTKESSKERVKPSPQPSGQTDGVADSLSNKYREAIHLKDWKGASEIRKEYKQHMKANSGTKLSNGRSMKHQLRVLDAKARRHKKKEARKQEKQQPQEQVKEKPASQPISEHGKRFQEFKKTVGKSVKKLGDSVISEGYGFVRLGKDVNSLSQDEKDTLDGLALFTRGNVDAVRDPAKWKQGEHSEIPGVAIKEKARDHRSGLSDYWRSGTTQEDYVKAHQVCAAISATPYSGDDIVHRGMQLDLSHFSSMQGGDEFDLSAISSWSSDRKKSVEFSGPGIDEETWRPLPQPPGKVPVVFSMNPSYGMDISKLSGYPRESEFIAGGKVRIKSIKPPEQEGGHYSVEVEHFSPESERGNMSFLKALRNPHILAIEEGFDSPHRNEQERQHWDSLREQSEQAPNEQAPSENLDPVMSDINSIDDQLKSAGFTVVNVNSIPVTKNF